MRSLLHTIIFSISLLFYSCNANLVFSQSITVLAQKLYSGEVLPRNELNTLFMHYSDNNTDSLKPFSEAVMSIGIEKDNWLYIGMGKLFLASYYNIQIKPNLSLPLSRQALDFFIKHADFNMICFSENQIGNAYINMKEYTKAKEWLNKSLKTAEQTSSFIENSIALKNLSECYYREKKYDQALATNAKFISILKDSKYYNTLSDAYLRAGKYYAAKGDNQKAKENYLEALTLAARHIAAASLKGNIFTNLAILYYEENPEQSKQYFIKALEERLITNRPNSISDAYLNLGSWYLGVNQFDSSKYYYEKLLDYSVKNHYLAGQVDAYEVLSDLYKYQNKYELAFEYLSKYKELALLKKDKDNKDAEYDIASTYALMEQEKELKNKNNTDWIRKTLNGQLRRNKDTILITLIAIIGISSFYFYNAKFRKNKTHNDIND